MLKPTLAAALQVPAGGGSLATAANVSLIIIAVAIVAVALMGGVVLFRFNIILSELRRSARQSFGPVSDRARSISENVEFVTQALRTDVEKLNSSIRALSDRLQQASDRMEERVEEFNALMAVVQDEAEDLFLDTASTVRGVREGARAMAGDSPGRPRIHASRPRAEDREELDEEETVERAAPPADPDKAVPTPDPEKAMSGGED